MIDRIRHLFREENYKYFYQTYVTIAVTMFHLGGCIIHGWPSPSLPILREQNSHHITITTDESSWITASFNFGIFIGVVPAGWMMHKFGHNFTLLVGALPTLLGWILVLTANRVEYFYAFMLCGGISSAISHVVLPMYIGEISSDRIRGFLSILFVVMGKLGLLYAYCIGPYVSLEVMAWLGMIPIIVFLLTYYWLPQSPYFLLGENRHQAALHALRRLRYSTMVEEELSAMDAAVQKTKTKNDGVFKEILYKKGNRDGLIIILGITSALTLCGSQILIAYGQTIFEKMKTGLSAPVLTIIFGVVQLVSSIFASAVVDSLGRRPLLNASVIGTALCNTIMAIYFHLERKGSDVSDFSWLAVLALMAFMVTYTIGMLTVLVTLISELFPKHLKPALSAIATMAFSVISFGLVKVFQKFLDDFGTDYAFYMFALFTYMFIPFVWFMVPETKCKSLDLILEEMNSNKKRSNIANTEL